MGSGLGKDVALITDGRFSGGITDLLLDIYVQKHKTRKHCLNSNGDKITINAVDNTIDVEI